MPLIKRLGEKVRQLREQAGLSQSELAKRLRMSENSKGYVSEIESGKKIPPVEKVLLISDIFNVTIDSLLRDSVEVEYR